MFKREGRGYYTRVWEVDPRRPRGGRERWVALGTDLENAKRQFIEIQVEGIRPERDGTVAQWARQWLAQYVAVHRTPKGQDLAETRVTKYLIPALGSKQVRRLTQEDLRGYRLWLQGLKKPPLALQSICHLLADAKCFVRWLYKSGVIGGLPIPDRLLPKVPESPPRGLNDVELAKLTTLPDPYGFACRVMLGTGVRWGELLRLQASDLKDGAISIHGPTKSRRSRLAPLPEALLAEIRGRVGRLVPFEDQPGSFARKVRRLSGIEEFNPHRLRHTYAYRWIRNGGSLATLQKVLGHAELETTMRYARPDEQLVAEDAAKVFARAAS
jgi:integrase